MRSGSPRHRDILIDMKENCNEVEFLSPTKIEKSVSKTSLTKRIGNMLFIDRISSGKQKKSGMKQL